MDKLYTFDEEKKTRWIWELLQNAKDVAPKDGVDVYVKLTDDELSFSHNGVPFKTKHLLALLYKTSTKSLGGEEGTTGKYGTGFVTTHILSRQLKLNGVHENNSGKRRFELFINRQVSALDENGALEAMQHILAETFIKINNISKSAPEEIKSEWNTFTYPLAPETFIYAEKGIHELERNVNFTLLINPRIRSISIEVNNAVRKYTASPHATAMQDVSFISTAGTKGILYTKINKLTIAISAKQDGDCYTLLPIEREAILHKEFPLIGTENFNLPVFIQHSDFQPTEQREGIRTKKGTEETVDATADKNRSAMKEFVSAYLIFIKTILDSKIGNTFILAKSGLPEFVEKFSNVTWYQENIQSPIRDFILIQEIVKTAKGLFKKVSEIRFPSVYLFENQEFYSLASDLIPDMLPDKESVWIWCRIVSQEPQLWPTGISINDEELVKLLPQKLDKSDEGSLDWLKRFYEYLETNNINHWGEKYPIYLNEDNALCLRNKVKRHPDIDEEFKVVSKGLGRPLNDEFLNRKLGKINAIEEFDLREFYTHLNKVLISELKIEKATPEQVKSIFHICTLFRSDKSSRREKWYDLIKQLLPDVVGQRKIVVVDYENYWRSAELWSIKYICSLIEKSTKPSVFAAQYFQSNATSCFEWLKDFLAFVIDLKDDDSEVLLKRSIIPTESDEFKPYDDNVFAMAEMRYFDDTIKNIYRDNTNKGDPRRFIIDHRVYMEGLRSKDVSILTNEIDKLFQASGIEARVKKGGNLNDMFLRLNDWFEKLGNPSNLLATFSSNRSSLYVLALGEGFSRQVMEMQSTGRTMEEITELAKTPLTNQEIKQLGEAAEILGADRLLLKAQEMLDAKKQVDRWKKIGDAAESAFKEAVTGLDFDYKIENPDIGRDFDLIINTKGYSIEIKSVAEGKENVRMSILQGRTAVEQKDNYALCVLTRPLNEEIIIDEAYFKVNSRFVTDIGEQIGDKIENWDNGLRTLQTEMDIKIQLEDKTESVYINRSIWRSGILFDDFIRKLKAPADSVEVL